MRKLLLLLGVACCCAATAAMAGPNAGGVLWVHDTGVAVTTDPVVWPADPVICPASIDNSVDADAVDRYWKVYAAFPAASLPRLKTIGWATEYTTNVENASAYVNVTGGDRVPPETAATVFFIGGLGFPTADGGTIGESFPPGARLTTVTPLFMFWGYGYQKDAQLYPCPTWAVAEKVGDNNFGDDMIPANTDPIADYGSLGFGCAGYTPCPAGPGACCKTDLYLECVVIMQSECELLGAPWVFRGAGTVCDVQTCSPPPPEGACCWFDGHCTFTTELLCAGDGTPHWTALLACSPNPCDQPPTGACCNIGTGACLITTQAGCPTLGYTWHPEWTSCVPNECPPPVPTETKSWGQIKSTYR